MEVSAIKRIYQSIEKIMPSLGNLFEFDYIQEKPEITIVNFCDEYSYFLFGSKEKQVLLKLNRKTIQKLKKKLQKNETEERKNEEIYLKFKAVLNQLKRINYSLEHLIEEKVKSSLLSASKEEIQLKEQKIMLLLDQKKQIQTDLMVWMDFLIEDGMI